MIKAGFSPALHQKGYYSYIYIGSFLKTQKCFYRTASAVIPLTYMKTKLNKQTKTFGKKRTPCFTYWSHVIRDLRSRIFELETKNSFVFHEQQIQLFLMKNLNLQQHSGIRNLLSSCYVTDTRYCKQYQKQPMISQEPCMPKKITEKLTRKLQYNELSANVWQVLRIWGECKRNT